MREIVEVKALKQPEVFNRLLCVKLENFWLLLGLRLYFLRPTNSIFVVPGTELGSREGVCGISICASLLSGNNASNSPYSFWNERLCVAVLERGSWAY